MLVVAPSVFRSAQSPSDGPPAHPHSPERNEPVRLRNCQSNHPARAPLVNVPTKPFPSHTPANVPCSP